MSENRLLTLLEQMRMAAADACSFTGGLSKVEFMSDKRTQQAVILNLMIIGEAATKLTKEHADFLAAHPGVPWANMKGMRNRIAHGYFDINLEVVWNTVELALPTLLEQLQVICRLATQGGTMPPQRPA